MAERTEAEKRDDALLEELDELLHDRGVYKITSMGWLDEDTPDPDYIGLNMWSQSPPVEWDYGFLARGRAAISPDKAAPWQRALAIACSDFEGLMVASRLSIGMTLRHSDTAMAGLFGDDTFYSLHRMNTLAHLGAASERIRDVFIGGVLKIRRNDFMPNQRGRTEYCAPIYEARKVHANQPKRWHEELSGLEHLCERVVEIQKIRNEVIHGVATRVGKTEQRLIENWKPRRDEQELDVASYQQARAHSKAMDEEHRLAISDEIATMIEWYDLLTHIANSVFLCEYAVRNRDEGEAVLVPN